MRVRGSRARTGARTSPLKGPRTRRRTRPRTRPRAPGRGEPRADGPRAGDEAPGGAAGRRFAPWLPGILIAGGIAFDLGTPPQYTAAPFLAAAPLVAAPFYSPRLTAVTAAVAVTAACLLAEFHGVGDWAQAATEVATVVTVALLALLTNHVIHRGGRRLASARGIAEAAQRAVLPAPPARLAGLDVAARYVAAERDAAIGGDLYAVQDTPHGVRMLIGDVRGKGLGAVEVVAITIGAFREAAEQEATLEGLALRLERALQRERARRGDIEQSEGFITAVLAEIPRGDSLLRLINRGHPAPLLLHADGSVCSPEPEVPALPLGMGDLGAWPDRVEELPFAEGVTLLLFTDGVSEARDERGVFYDPAVRLRGLGFAGPVELLDALVADVERHTGGGTADDMALLALRRSPVTAGTAP
ncbi:MULTISPECIES: PP2C family protein-serine/threonine phosphatase [Streptomyces]|uniref:PP2C family protein-serine/threonine phosphatase n=1 Tax=Streptomyces lonegramiae TaxID=3075524 RepID=A0ABU2XUN2_9ACTN|nr:PP2C family protein-serine/threonine phosphatase [Streptomyces sp. DSM 41529]MDT0548518.1 PP2C family protein-serine/threonine phosphatase [Streptomyces sp. DSM 41529]